MFKNGSKFHRNTLRGLDFTKIVDHQHTMLTVSNPFTVGQELICLTNMCNNRQMIWVVFATRCRFGLLRVDDVNTSMSTYSIRVCTRAALPLDLHSPAFVIIIPGFHFQYLSNLTNTAYKRNTQLEGGGSQNNLLMCIKYTYTSKLYKQ